MLKLKYNFLKNFVKQHELEYIKPYVELATKQLFEKKSQGSSYLGWLDLPVDYDREEFDKIKKVSSKIQKESDALVVIGIGGSYLGAKAALEFMLSPFNNELEKEKRDGVKVYFVGTNMSTRYFKQLEQILENQDFSINVISKSGTTLEPSLAFRYFKKILEKKYGKEEAASRIYATTDKEKGALKDLSNKEKYETFVIPSNIGGRYSVLTAVGLLPIAAAGLNIDELMEGARLARREYLNNDFDHNDTMIYAAIRNILYRKNKVMEIFVNYEPCLNYINEWLKQLFNESEGKDNKGIYVSSANFSTDLHSIGQAIQEGQRNIFETVLNIEAIDENITVQKEDTDIDGLNFLSGKTMDEINKLAMQGVILAHTDGNVPNIVINIKNISLKSLGYMFYFFEQSCAISGYLNCVNPFDQPGVESYKKNMFALLEKPGLEKETEKVLKRLEEIN